MTVAKSTGPVIRDLPPAPPGKKGWPWTESGVVSNTPSSVSIVVPCKNAVSFIEESIRSVLLQGIPNLQLIVIDGGSTDGTIDIIRRYEPWISDWISEPDRGQSNAINKGLARCRGSYFNWHNGDDILLPGSLAETLEGFERYPDAMYICRPRKLLYPDGRIENKTNHPTAGEYSLRNALLSGCPGSQPGGLMRLDEVKKVGGLQEDFYCCMDEELMMKLRLRGPGYYLEKPGFIFRVHPDQQSTVLLRERIAEKVRIIEASFEALPEGHPFQHLRASAHIFAAQHAASLCRNQGKRMQALRWYLYSNGSSGENKGEDATWSGRYDRNGPRTLVKLFTLAESRNPETDFYLFIQTAVM